MNRIIFVCDIARMSRKRNENNFSSKERIRLSSIGSPMANAVMDKWIEESEGQWSPTPEDFDKLIAEQKCFEIGWREEKKKTLALEKEFKSLKHDLKKERKDRMLCEQERNQALTKVATLEHKVNELEKQVAEHEAEIEDLKTMNSLFLKSGVSATACQKHADVNNNAEGDIPDANQENIKANKRENRRSLVALRIQGFEAVSSAQTQTQKSQRSRDVPRRKTCPGFLQEALKASEPK